MALLTKQEFRDLCGLTPNMFRTYRGRNKFGMTGEHIDDSDPTNKAFIESRLLHLAKQDEKSGAESRSSDDNSEDDDEIGTGMAEGKQKEGAGARNVNFSNSASMRLDEEKKAAEIKRIESTTKLNELRIQKQEGELIPTELVRPLFAQISKSLSAAYKTATDNLIVEIAHKKKFSLDEIADLRARLTFEINDAIKKAVADAKKQSERISDDFASKRG